MRHRSTQLGMFLGFLFSGSRSGDNAEDDDDNEFIRSIWFFLSLKSKPNHVPNGCKHVSSALSFSFSHSERIFFRHSSFLFCFLFHFLMCIWCVCVIVYLFVCLRVVFFSGCCYCYLACCCSSWFVTISTTFLYSTTTKQYFLFLTLIYYFSFQLWEINNEYFITYLLSFGIQDKKATLPRKIKWTKHAKEWEAIEMEKK